MIYRTIRSSKISIYREQISLQILRTYIIKGIVILKYVEVNYIEEDFVCSEFRRCFNV